MPALRRLFLTGRHGYWQWVDDMVQVLNGKKVARGNVGQMKKAEQQEARVEDSTRGRGSTSTSATRASPLALMER